MKQQFLLNQLGVKYPIFLSPMAGVTTPQLAAEVSNAGGLGALGLGASDLNSCYQQIRQTQELTNQPFQVNFFCHTTVAKNLEQHQEWVKHLRPHFNKLGKEPPTSLECIYPSFLDNDDFVDVILETGVKIVSLHFGVPRREQVEKLKKAGVFLLATATNLAEARALEQANIDAIVAQGIEAGGHRGIFHSKRDAAITTLDLVKLLAKSTHLPIIAAGGIMNGQDAAVMLKSGASAVQMGTAFIQCNSSNASTPYKEALFNQPVTQITETISGRPARGIVNAWHHLDDFERPTVADYPYAYDLAKQLHQIANKENSQDYAAFWAGTGVGRIRSMSAEHLVQTIWQEICSCDK